MKWSVTSHQNWCQCSLHCRCLVKWQAKETVFGLVFLSAGFHSGNLRAEESHFLWLTQILFYILLFIHLFSGRAMQLAGSQVPYQALDAVAQQWKHGDLNTGPSRNYQLNQIFKTVYLKIITLMQLLWGWRRLLRVPWTGKEIQPVHPKGDQTLVFIGRTDIEAETSIHWPLDAKSWLIWKDPNAMKDWGQEEKGMTDG